MFIMNNTSLINNYYLNCVLDFKKLLNSNFYISKSIYENFLEKYKNVLETFVSDTLFLDDDVYNELLNISNNGYILVEKYNKKYVDEKLIEYKIYFDSMFKEVDSSIILDEEQRRAIISNEDYSLIVAGAGSGKTTTMAAKVKYLIDKQCVKEDKIILLAFTNKAKEELERRINIDFKLRVKVSTFHSLGIEFLRKIFNSPVKITDESGRHSIISDYVQNFIFSNKVKLSKFKEIFRNYLTFDDKIFEYDKFEDYFLNYVDEMYEKIVNNNELSKWVEKRIDNRKKKLKTIEGEYLKSIGEVNIANFLYENNYKYEYEKLYKHKVEGDRSYSPDFTLHYGDEDIYIEYYGMSTYTENGFCSLDDVNNYRNLIEKKRQLHKRYGTDLIELYPFGELNYIEVLKQELDKRHIFGTIRTEKEIFYKLYLTSQELHYFKLINLMNHFIKVFKSKGYTNDNFRELISNEKDEMIINQLLFTKEIYNYYNNKIHSEYKVDFEDMINLGYRNMEILKNNYKNISYDYIIVDEYQDISFQRYNFIKKLSDLFTAKIVAVGDDWQAIYGFSGSDINLFTNFYNLMGYADILKITNTYRNSQELIDIAGEFVSKNVNQLDKKLISEKHIDNPVEVVYYNEKDISFKALIILNIIKKNYENNNKSTTLLLGRYKDDIDELISSKLFFKIDKSKILAKDINNANIEFLTIHSAKGLGYDNVVILNMINDKKGFPSKIEDEPLIKKISNKELSEIEYPEERRLFYVALTRTKNKVYLLCPNEPYELRSDFVKEIVKENNVIEVNT